MVLSSGSALFWKLEFLIEELWGWNVKRQFNNQANARRRATLVAKHLNHNTKLERCGIARCATRGSDLAAVEDEPSLLQQIETSPRRR